MVFDDIFKPKKSQKSRSILGNNFDLGLGNKKNNERDKRRTFTRTQKNEIWAQQNGKCAKCKNKLDPRTVEYDHKKGWADNGQTVIVNGQALCANCHKLKTHKTRLKKVESKKNNDKKSSSLNLFDKDPFKLNTKKKNKSPFDFKL